MNPTGFVPLHLKRLSSGNNTGTGIFTQTGSHCLKCYCASFLLVAPRAIYISLNLIVCFHAAADLPHSSLKKCFKKKVAGVEEALWKLDSS